MKRRWLLLGAFSGAVLTLGGGSLALMRPGMREGRLSESGREVFGGAARGLLDGIARADEISPMIARVDALVFGLPPHVQGELSQLLALLASAPGRIAFAGLASPWTQASVQQIQNALQSMRLSAVSLRQQAYQALHDIVGAAYFSDEATWPSLDYPGPKSI
jgi:hypothetical protein